MEWATKGASALTGHDQAPAAINYFTKALIEHPSSPDYFTQRAVAFSRLKPARHDLALRDAEYAILLAQRRAKREKIQGAQQRRVVALYGLGRYHEARWLLSSMLKWRDKDNKKEKMEHDMWMAKINGKIKDREDEVDTFTEYPDVDLPDESTMRKWLQEQLKKDGTFRFDGEAEAEGSITAATKIQLTHDSADEFVDSKAEPPKSIPSSVRHDFYQNNNNLIVTFYAKKVDPSRFTFNLDSDSVSLADIFCSLR
jgi:suppressor of G2 allele of SKP1